MPDSSDVGPRTLNTLENGCSVIRALRELNGATVTALADHLEMSKGGVYTHLATFEQEELVRKVDGEYRLSARFFRLGEFVKHRDPLYRVGRNEIENLAEETGESTHLMVEQFGRGFYYHKVPGERGIPYDLQRNLMERANYLHWSSTGKAVLAELPKERVEEIIDQHGLPARTEHTITDRDELRDELQEIQQRGYALQDAEQIRSVRAVGASVKARNGEVLGAISVSGPTSRIDDEKFYEKLPEQITHSTNVIELNLEATDTEFDGVH